MIELAIQRIKLLDSSTLGLLSYPGTGPEFFTLEDKVRELPGVPVEQWKLPQITAIPIGRYRVVMDMSSRFNREMPHLLDVPGFTGVRIHAGNTAVDTEGCPLIGFSASIMTGSISQSAPAAFAFYDKLREFLKQSEVWISIKNP